MEAVYVRTWQYDTERAAHSFLAGHPYLASLGFDEVSGDEESKAGARLGLISGVVAPEKFGEKFRLAAFGDADSRVGDIDSDKVRDFFTGNRYYGPRWGVFTSITQQALDDLGEPVLVRVNRSKTGRNV